jgi:hypothetical protein
VARTPTNLQGLLYCAPGSTELNLLVLLRIPYSGYLAGLRDADPNFSKFNLIPVSLFSHMYGTWLESVHYFQENNFFYTSTKNKVRVDGAMLVPVLRIRITLMRMRI